MLEAVDLANGFSKSVGKVKVLEMNSRSIKDLLVSSAGKHFLEPHLNGQRNNGLEARKLEVEQPTTSRNAEMHTQPFVIGVSGGAASGKTTVCDMIIEQLRDQRVVLVNQESFYHNLSEEELERVHEYNFDHPDAFDTDKLLHSLECLKHGKAVYIPNYDFRTNKYIMPPRKVNPSDVIILEGILIFHDPRVRESMNMKIFVDTDADVRLARRIQRDTAEKNRDINTVLDQLIYHNLPKDIADRHVLLLDPILGTDNSTTNMGNAGTKYDDS